MATILGVNRRIVRFRAGDASSKAPASRPRSHPNGSSATCGRALADLGRNAGLELVMVTAGRGAYVAGAEISLHGASSGGATLRGVADGPICFFKLPPGDYRIEASLDGTRREARAVVKAGGKRARVVIAFPEARWDGIRASDEEKRQARAP